jgi:hypothetical protein
MRLEEARLIVAMQQPNQAHLLHRIIHKTVHQLYVDRCYSGCPLFYTADFSPCKSLDKVVFVLSCAFISERSLSTESREISK